MTFVNCFYGVLRWPDSEETKSGRIPNSQFLLSVERHALGMEGHPDPSASRGVEAEPVVCHQRGFNADRRPGLG